ncbi:hypothetical protein ABZP36_004440 [Zizania latifolia]
MATASTSGDPATAGEPTPSSAASAQPRQPTSRISHIVRTYLDLSSNPKKLRASPKSRPKSGGHETPATGGGKDGGKAGNQPAQSSRLLRELGVRVSRYTHEERRDIILRYTQKRSGRQGVKRAATKVSIHIVRIRFDFRLRMTIFFCWCHVARRSHQGRLWRSGGGGVPEGSSSARRAPRYSLEIQGS